MERGDSPAAFMAMRPTWTSVMGGSPANVSMLPPMGMMMAPEFSGRRIWPSTMVISKTVEVNAIQKYLSAPLIFTVLASMKPPDRATAAGVGGWSSFTAGWPSPSVGSKPASTIKAGSPRAMPSVYFAQELRRVWEAFLASVSSISAAGPSSRCLHAASRRSAATVISAMGCG